MRSLAAKVSTPVFLFFISSRKSACFLLLCQPVATVKSALECGNRAEAMAHISEVGYIARQLYRLLEAEGQSVAALVINAPHHAG
jgi:hypothetical protein